MNEEVPQSGVSSFFCVYDEPSAGKALPQTIIFTLDKMISFKKEKNYEKNRKI